MTQAQFLHKGDLLSTVATTEASLALLPHLARSGIAVESIQLLDSTVSVYNFEVSDFHTYFVESQSIWVHNACSTALLSDIKKWVHTEFNAQSVDIIKVIEQQLLANDPWVWQEHVYTTVINGKTYLLDGHHRIQAAININFTGDIPFTEIPIAEISKFRGGQYKNAQDVIIASKKIH